MLFFSTATATTEGYERSSWGGEEKRQVGVLGRWARRMFGQRGEPKAEPPRPALTQTRSRSSASSASFLSRFSSFSTSSSPASSAPPSPTTLSHPTSFIRPPNPILNLVLPHLRTLRSLSTRANDLTRTEASTFVAQLDHVSALHPNVGRDVRHGVEVTFMRGGGEELSAYLRWVVGEVERGVGLGAGGRLGSWGWDVDRMIPILSILLHRLTTSPSAVNPTPFITALRPIDSTTASAVEAICSDQNLWREQKVDLVRDMCEDLETTVRMYWEDHTTPLYHLSTFSFYIGPPTPSPHPRSRRPYGTPPPRTVYCPSPASSRAPSLEDAPPNDADDDEDGEEMEWIDNGEEIEFEMVVPLPTPDEMGTQVKGAEGMVWWVEGSPTGEKVCEAWWVDV